MQSHFRHTLPDRPQSSAGRRGPRRRGVMKLRDSGMPPQDYWESLLDARLILDRFGIRGRSLNDVAELGCGYGTFTLPLAERVAGTVYAFDIDPEMVETTRRRATEAGLVNVC